MKLYNLINPKIIILVSFIFSIIISNYNLNKYDNFFVVDGEQSYHKMIKFDAYRYMSHGAEIKKDIEDGKSFFESGREHFTKYLPPRIAAAYYYILDINLFDNFQNKKINLGIHFPYLIMQCLIYYISLLYLYSIISKKFENKVSLGIIFFLALEPTIFQYHGTFWTESIFFSIQLIIIGLILNNKLNSFNFFTLGIFLSLLSLQKQVAYFYIGPILIYYLFFIEKKNSFSHKKPLQKSYLQAVLKSDSKTLRFTTKMSQFIPLRLQGTFGLPGKTFHRLTISETVKKIKQQLITYISKENNGQV